MAKLKFLRNLNEEIGAFQEGFFELSVKKNGKEGTWTNDTTEVEIVVEGSGLKAAKDDSEFYSAGKITDLSAINADGKTVLDISGLDLKAEKLSAVFADGGVFAVIGLLTKGKDTAVGTNKADFIFSGAGNDVLTGKNGSDYFIFQAIEENAKSGKSKEYDVITDFDTKGEDMDILEFNSDIAGFKDVNKGKDTLVTFEDGSKLLLEGVKEKQFDAYVDGFEVT